MRVTWENRVVLDRARDDLVGSEKATEGLRKTRKWISTALVLLSVSVTVQFIVLWTHFFLLDATEFRTMAATASIVALSIGVLVGSLAVDARMGRYEPVQRGSRIVDWMTASSGKYPQSVLQSFGAGLAMVVIGVLFVIASLFAYGGVLVYPALILWIVGGLLIYGAVTAEGRHGVA